MKKYLLVVLLLSFSSLICQNFQYSFISEYKTIKVKGRLYEVLPEKRTYAEIKICNKKCLIIENNSTIEFEILSSTLLENPTRIQIKAVKNGISYDLELILVRKNEYLFIVENKLKLEVYKTSKIKKTKQC